MNASELENATKALPTPLSADPATSPGSTTVRATRCTCTGERPSAGFCPACHFVADWVPVEYAAAFVTLANHGPALIRLLAACEQWRAAIDARRAYGEGVYRQNPFDLCSEFFRVESARLDRAVVDRQRDIMVAMADIHGVITGTPEATEARQDPSYPDNVVRRAQTMGVHPERLMPHEGTSTCDVCGCSPGEEHHLPSHDASSDLNGT